ncbi:uracil phosphoribosyltransferase [Egibacter rhizosphaerae]|uniref:Uracil phosphoribosyltransferase n=1 Tax=Egibacter rhizosphaerae TaxID=1670831 RepID=A0A411YIQ4_9ACTN|nr:uracil phosphoribosyltransferase [Egibacter rhizosphaerae]QBI21174.1 uracil phosphoribosyltransferase [Egibacter rhizosphaerae]
MVEPSARTPANVSVVEHPLTSHLLAGLRDESTPPEQFRHLSKRLSTVLVLEATRNLPTRRARVTTPLEEADAELLDGGVVAVPILRAGLGLLEAVTDLLPDVQVGYAGLERDESTLQPTSYYLKVPNLDGTSTLLLDPMLATGGSAAFAASLLKERGARNVQLVCVVAAPEGIERLANEHPDVGVVTGAIDSHLNDVGFIVPGLGDFGDRLFGTS